MGCAQETELVRGSAHKWTPTPPEELQAWKELVAPRGNPKCELGSTDRNSRLVFGARGCFQVDCPLSGMGNKEMVRMIRAYHGCAT